jgi:K+-sensing histidine kinase KdpD
VTDSPDTAGGSATSIRQRLRRAIGQDPRAAFSTLLETAVSAAVALAAIGVTTVVLLALESHLDADHLVIGYLLPTVVIAMHYGGTLAILTSFFSGIMAAYFLFPPKLSFYIAEPLHAAELGFVLLLAVTAGKAVAKD